MHLSTEASELGGARQPAKGLSPAVLRRSTPCKHPKKLDIEGATSSDRCGDSKTAEVSITVRAMSGAVLYNRCIQSSSSGKWLLDQVLQQHPRSGSGVGKLLREKVHIDASKPLGEQGVTDGSELAMVWLPISREQQVAAVKKMTNGHLLDEDDMDAFNSLSDVCWGAPGLDIHPDFFTLSTSSLCALQRFL